MAGGRPCAAPWPAREREVANRLSPPNWRTPLRAAAIFLSRAVGALRAALCTAPLVAPPGAGGEACSTGGGGRKVVQGGGSYRYYSYEWPGYGAADAEAGGRRVPV